MSVRGRDADGPALARADAGPDEKPKRKPDVIAKYKPFAITNAEPVLVSNYESVDEPQL